MTAIGLTDGMQVADVGAGDGYFTVRFARRVGVAGRIWANEIDDRLLANIARRCERENLANVETVLGSPDDPNLPAGALDLVVLVNVVHLIDDPVRFLDRLIPALKPGGHLAIVQWDAVKLARESPTPDDTTDVAEFLRGPLLRNIAAAGFRVDAEETFLPLQNIYLCAVR